MIIKKSQQNIKPLVIVIVISIILIFIVGIFYLSKLLKKGNDTSTLDGEVRRKLEETKLSQDPEELAHISSQRKNDFLGKKDFYATIEDVSIKGDEKHLTISALVPDESKIDTVEWGSGGQQVLPTKEKKMVLTLEKNTTDGFGSYYEKGQKVYVQADTPVLDATDTITAKTITIVAVDTNE